MMKEMTPEERDLVYKLRRLTKKNLLVCLMCLRYKNGNFHRALQFCSEPTLEAERLSKNLV